MNFLKHALLNNFRLSTVSRFSFVIDLIIAVIKQFFFMASWYFFFDHYKLVKGWKFDDLLLMYGILSCSIGVVEVFFLV